MDQFFARIILLDEAALSALPYALLAGGGVVGAMLLTVNITIRRSTYLLYGSFIALILAITQIGWLFIGPAAEAGLFGATVAGLYGAFLISGIATYAISAARSRDVRGDTARAWLGFIPLANLWLLFKAGAAAAPSNARPRSGFARFVGDPLLITLGLVVFILAQSLVAVLERTLSSRDVYESPALQSIIRDAVTAKGETVEQVFAREASLAQSSLPIQVDGITILTKVQAEGTVLLMYHLVTDPITISSAFRQLLAEDQCQSNRFHNELTRGGRIQMTYVDPNGAIIGDYTITGADCA